MDEERRQTLQSSRLARARKLLDERGIVIEAAERLAEKLNEEIARGHATAAFLIALALAAFKDFFDFFANLILALLAAIPVVGPVLAAVFAEHQIAVGIFISLTLAIFLWGKGWFLQTRIKAVWWVLGFFIDNIPAVSALPITTFAVLYAWGIVRKRAAAAEKKLPQMQKMTADQIESLYDDLSGLDEEEE